MKNLKWKQRFSFPPAKPWVHQPRLQQPSCSTAWENLFSGDNFCKARYSMQLAVTSVKLHSAQDKNVIMSRRGLRKESTMQTAHKSYHQRSQKQQRAAMSATTAGWTHPWVQGNVHSPTTNTTCFEPCVPTQEPFILFHFELNISRNFNLPSATQQSREGREELDHFLTPRERKTVSRGESWPLAGTSAKRKPFPGSLVPDGFTLGRGTLAAGSTGSCLSLQMDGFMLLWI